MQLKVAKLNPAAVLPVRGTPKSAGLDLHILEEATIQPRETKMLQTGIAAEIPDGYFGLVVPRSSAFRKGFVIQGVVDSDYRGEIFVVATNAGSQHQRVPAGTALAQMLIISYADLEIVETPRDDLSKTGRGDGGWGSTGRTA